MPSRGLTSLRYSGERTQPGQGSQKVSVSIHCWSAAPDSQGLLAEGLGSASSSRRSLVPLKPALAWVPLRFIHVLVAHGDHSNKAEHLRLIHVNCSSDPTLLPAQSPLRHFFGHPLPSKSADFGFLCLSVAMASEQETEFTELCGFLQERFPSRDQKWGLKMRSKGFPFLQEWHAGNPVATVNDSRVACYKTKLSHGGRV